MTRQQLRAVQAFHGGGNPGMSGLGITSQQATSTVGSSLLITGGVIAAIPGLQIPGAIIAAVGALTSLIGGLFRPDVTKIQATHIVDQIESQVLQPTLAQWRALPASQRTVSMQAHFVNIVDQALNAVREGCSNPALQEAGQRCISERLIPGGSAPWCPTSTGCDWITLYRSPISSDPNVIPDPSGMESVGGSVFGGGQGVSLPLLIGAGLVLGGLLWD